jgi:hypothetical protein
LCDINVESIGGEMETVNVDVGWDADTVYVTGVKKVVMDLGAWTEPRGGGFGSPGLRWYGDMTWLSKDLTTAESLLVVEGDVRR